MPELPTGTVTFLFTDIEGSTRLLQQPEVEEVRLERWRQARLRSAVVTTRLSSVTMKSAIDVITNVGSI